MLQDAVWLPLCGRTHRKLDLGGSTFSKWIGLGRWAGWSADENPCVRGQGSLFQCREKLDGMPPPPLFSFLFYKKTSCHAGSGSLHLPEEKKNHLKICCMLQKQVLGGGFLRASRLIRVVGLGTETV